jgi:sugar phosphate isomerase/epimerase
LEIADIDHDGNLDIFTTEQGKWTTEPTVIDNPKATAWILFGDGNGNFRTIILDQGEGWHDGKLADFDGDGDLDILQKPYAWDAPRVDVWLNNGTGVVTLRPGKMAASYSLHSFQSPVGMELWTYRRQLEKDLQGTLDLIHRLGITEVEASGLFGKSATDFRGLLDHADLKCTSFVATYERLQTDFDGAAKDAKTIGAKYIVVPWIPHSGPLTEEEVHKATKDFNVWGEKLQAQGITLGYQPHGFEFGHTKIATLFDLLLAETSKEFITFELDTFWFRQGGVDPARFLEKYPDRFQLMHLKDIASGTKQDLSGSAPEISSVIIGSGTLHW